MDLLDSVLVYEEIYGQGSDCHSDGVWTFTVIQHPSSTHRREPTLMDFYLTIDLYRDLTGRFGTKGTQLGFAY